MTRKTRLAAVALTAVLLPLTLSGCLRTSGDIQVGANGDIGTALVQVGIDKDIAKSAGIYNLAGFEAYIKTNKRVESIDTCVFDEDTDEYLMDCRTANVVDNTGTFTGITTSTSNGNLILMARKGAMTADLAKYDPNGLAVGSITFYFDGTVVSVNAPSSDYRMPSPEIVTFDLKDGNFFQENATVVIAPRANYLPVYLGLLGLTGLVIIAALFAKRQRPETNPFTVGEDVEAPHEVTPVFRSTTHDPKEDKHN